MIFAPTGQFRPGNLSNPGMGEWTVMPNFAHTYLWEKRGLEFDNFVGFDIYSQNNTTKYTSGTVFHWEGMVIQYLSKRVGFGAIVSNLTQLTNDTGPVADVLHGFEGRSWGVAQWLFTLRGLKSQGSLYSCAGSTIQGDKRIKGQHISARPHSEDQLTGVGRKSAIAAGPHGSDRSPAGM